jgi:hypothetical protein
MTEWRGRNDWREAIGMNRSEAAADRNEAGRFGDGRHSGLDLEYD